MDYEKKYKEALERAREVIKNNPDFVRVTPQLMEEIFPGIAESEDERISREITEFILTHRIDEPNDIEDTNTWLAWLEKQSEQKSIFDFNANNWYVSKVDGKIHNIYNSGVEPKFHKDEWVVNNATLNLCHILRVEHGQYICDDCSFPITKENEYHLWTIADAKDGDVLLFEGYYNSIVLFQGIGINGKGRINYHCKCDLGDYSFSIQGDVACLGTIEKDAEHYHPATKEQRDLLFQKMEESGYEWDEVNKKLKKIEEEYDGEDYGIDSLFHAQRILEKTLGKVDGYQTDDGILSHKCAITAVKKLYEQKPAEWSEEDEENLKHCCYLNKDEILSWLQSLKQRMIE